jgi:hypothetical protein
LKTLWQGSFQFFLQNEGISLVRSKTSWKFAETSYVSDLRLSLGENVRFQKWAFSACFQAENDLFKNSGTVLSANNLKKSNVVHRDRKNRHLFWTERILAGTVGYLVCLRGPSFQRAVGSQLPHAGVNVMGAEQALAHLFHLGHAHNIQVLRLLLGAPETAKYE